MKSLENAITFNIETTGVDIFNDEIISCTVGTFNGDNLVTETTYYDCDADITPEISSLNDITQEMLEGSDKFSELKGYLHEVIEGKYLVTMNPKFHVNMANINGDNFIELDKVICIGRICRRLNALGLDIKNNKLNYLRYYLGVDIKREELDSSTEMKNVIIGKVFHKLCMILFELGEIQNIDVEEVCVWANGTIITNVMPLGKHSGKLFQDIPLDYWNWALSNMDCLIEDHINYDPDLSKSIAIALDKII